MPEARGLVNFSPNQTFSGTGTIMGVTAGGGLTGGGSSGLAASFGGYGDFAIDAYGTALRAQLKKKAIHQGDVEARLSRLEQNEKLRSSVALVANKHISGSPQH